MFPTSGPLYWIPMLFVLWAVYQGLKACFGPVHPDDLAKLKAHNDAWKAKYGAKGPATDSYSTKGHSVDNGREQ